jgi:hypothetical protein
MYQTTMLESDTGRPKHVHKASITNIYKQRLLTCSTNEGKAQPTGTGNWSFQGGGRMGILDPG